MRKLTSLILILMIMFVTSGCSFAGMSDDDLLQPPKAMGVKAEIQNLLENTTKGDYKLKYPQSGDYRSAIIMHDIGGDEEEEAMAFYKTAKDNSNINIIFMKEAHDEWEVISTYTNPNSDIDRIYFGDVDNDGKSEVIVAWTSYMTASNQIILYDYSNDEIQQIIVSGKNTTYTEMVMSDITNDNIDDLVVFTTYPTDEQLSKTTTSAILYSNCVDGTFSKVSEISTVSNITSYSQIITGNVDKQTKGLFVDGYTQNQNEQLTQVIYYSKDDQILKNPLNIIDSLGESQNITLRDTVTVCKDVDNDGITEIPSVYTPLVSLKSVSSSPIIRWNKMDTKSETVEKVVDTYSNYFDNYYFVLPEQWENRVVASNENSSRTTIFYEIDGTDEETINTAELPSETTRESATVPEISSEPESKTETVTVNSEPLLTLKVFTEKVWKNEGTERLAEGYVVIKDQSGLIYTCKLGKTDEHKLDISTKQVTENFNIIK
ncbi:MAG: VCBS repeat-containing protein [Clostridia bacterium]|nr:VCBS repeat-containing protein [Clostridia bacterium]